MSRKGFGVVGVVDAGRRPRRHRHRRRPAPAHGRAARPPRRGGDDPGAAHDRDHGARLRGARGDERAARSPRSSPPPPRRPGGRPASCTSTTACAPASAEPHGGRAGPPLAGRGDPEGRAAARRARHAARACSSASPASVPTEGGLVFAPRRRRGAGQRPPDPQPDLQRHHARRRPLPLPRRALVEPDAAPPTRAAITALAGDLDLADGPTVDGQRRPRRPRRPDPAARPRRRRQHRDLGRLPDPRREGDARPARRVDDRRRRGREHRPARPHRLGQPARRPGRGVGEVRRFSFGDGVRLLYDPPDPG